MDQSQFVPGVGDLLLVGRGGTAAVFRSLHLASGRTVAVKVLNARLTAADQIRRFDNDMANVAALNNERSIVEVLASGVNEGGHPWVITTYLPDNLAAILAEHGRITWTDAVAVGTEVARALSAAHRQGVLHGDLKAADIRFDSLGVPLLADLGLFGFAGTDPNAPVTGGKLVHCAPEVAAGGLPDALSDVYSLASVLYEAMSGRPPFGAPADREATDLAERIGGDVPAPLTGFGVPSDVDGLIRTALSTERSERPQSAGEFALALAAVAPTTRSPGAGHGDPPSPDGSLSVGGVPFDELDTPPDGYPLIDEFPVLDDDEAAPLLAAAGRRERRRRRERRVASIAVILAILSGTVTGAVVWITSRNGGNNGPTTTVPDTTVAGEVSPPGTDTLRPVPTVSYAFVASFDSKQATASLSGVASPTGAARLKNALASVGRLENDLQIQDGPEPDSGTSVDDAITLLASMRRNLTAGTLRFDGQTFSLSGFYQDEKARSNLQDVITLMRTPAARPDLTPDPDAAAVPATTDPAGATTATIEISARPTSFSIPADGRFHILPVTLVPSGGSTQLCLNSRTVSGPEQQRLIMNYSSCGLARIVTLSSSLPGTYTVIDTFTDERGPSGPTGTVTFVVVVT